VRDRVRDAGAIVSVSLKTIEERLTMPTFIEQIHAKAKTSPRKVVLQEGEDVRIIEAAAMATKQGIAEITILGNPDKIKATAAGANISLDKIAIVDMTSPPNFDDYANTYFELRMPKA
jgi:phosphotransacetylase